MNDCLMRWTTLIAERQPTAILHKALWYVAYSITSMTGQEITIAGRRIETVPLDKLAATANDPDAPMIGVYLLLGDDLPGQAMLMLSLADALALVDRLLDQAPGTTVQFGEIERSLLGELGNLSVSSFLNVVAQPEWGPLYPSAPAVMVDMLGTILDAIATSIATTRDEVLIIDTTFRASPTRQILRLWVIPDLLPDA